MDEFMKLRLAMVESGYDKHFTGVVADWAEDHGMDPGLVSRLRNGCSMPEALSGDDWGEVFGYCGDPCGNSQGRPPSVTLAYPHAKCDTGAFGRGDVMVISHMAESYNDGPDWICVGELWDGRYFIARAGCDYTGWDCQASGYGEVADDLQEMIRLGLSKEDQERLGIKQESAINVQS